MNQLHDTLVMTKRCLRHAFRNVGTLMNVVIMPIAIMLLFVFVFGGSTNTGSASYINYIVPGIVIMCLANGVAFSALRLNNDVTKGIINRFRCMPIAPSSILAGHVVTSLLSNLFSVMLVLLVAVLLGFRPEAGLLSWLAFGGIITLFTLATTWLAIIFGLIAKNAESAGAFSYIILLLTFLSSAFAPTEGMHTVVRAFAEHQPVTPVIETLRSLVAYNTPGDNAWTAVAWCVGLLVVAYYAALRIYKSQTVA